MASTTIFRLKFNRNYTTFVKTGRGIVKVDFTPIVLFGRTENSQFGTADPEVVEGLKKHRDFGSLFFIEEEGMPGSAKEEADAAPAASTKRRAIPLVFFCGADGRSGRCEGSPVRRTEAAVEEIGKRDGKFGRKVYLCVAKRPAECRSRRRKWIRYRF